MVFQTEIYAILQCAWENIRAYKHKWILNFFDSQAVLKALSSPKVTSGLVAECLDALPALASRNEVTLVWVPGQCSIPGKEKDDKLARQGAAMLLLSPELALGIPRCSAREAIKNWIECQHRIAWKNLPGHRHGKLFISRPCKKRAEDLLTSGRHQLRMVFDFLTGHAPVKKHLNIMGLDYGPV
jgi:hypothetical protein